MLPAEEAVRRLTAACTRSIEEGLPLSPLTILAIIEGRVPAPEEKARPLSRDVPWSVGSSGHD